MRRVLSAGLALLLAASVALAASDADRAQRVARLSEQLRCLVCQNQSIADSNAPLALDLKRQILEQVDAGRSNEQVIEYMVQRYGDFVLYRPPLRAATALLWVGPFALLLGAAAWVVRRLGPRRRAPMPAALSEEERARATALLGRSKEESG